VQQDIEKVSKYYDSFLASEPGKYSSLAEFTARYEPIISFLENKRGELKVLDIGCGTGMASEKLKRFGKVYGIDISPKSIEQAAQRLDEAKVGIAEDIAYPNEVFDAVVCTETLEHVLKPQLAIREFYRVLRAKGNLLISTPNPWNWRIVLTGLYAKTHKKQTNTGQIIEHYLSPPQLKQLLQSNGFIIEEYRTVFFRPQFIKWLPIAGLYQVCIATKRKERI